MNGELSVCVCVCVETQSRDVGNEMIKNLGLIAHNN